MFLELALAALSFVNIEGRADFLKSDSEATKAAILERFPVGSEIPRARAIMETEGVNCREFENEKYAEYPAEGGGPISRGPANFLWCDSGERGLIVTKRWQVIFLNVDGLVAGVTVSVGLSGPCARCRHGYP